MEQPVAIDLFCGAGGMGLGFAQAGFNVLAAFDAEQRHVDVYNSNSREQIAHVADLAKCQGQQLRTLAGIDDGEIDVVFGGPPCQGFSRGGLREADDSRNSLILDFARLVRQLKPTYFVMENVDGILQGEAQAVVASLTRRMRRNGYELLTPIRVLDASNYGVPQRRKRVFIVGWKRGATPIGAYPPPTPIIDEQAKTYFPTVRDALQDLPRLGPTEKYFERDEYEGALGRPGHYAKLMRGMLVEKDDKLGARRCDRLSGCMLTRHSEETQRRFGNTSQGSREMVSRFLRLDPNGLAPTLRAGTGVDRGKHTAPRPIHPVENRCITTREGARLHSFPDWFQFHGTKWHAFRQIGNSVPPRLARVIAAEVLHVLHQGT